MKIVIYDPHSWSGDKEFSVIGNDERYDFKAMEISERPSYSDVYLICDEYTVTDFPFFFPRKNRVAVLKESPIYTNKLDLSFLAENFDLIITHNKNILDKLDNSVRVDFSSTWVELQDSIPLKEKLVSFIGNISHSSVNYSFRKAVYANLVGKSVDLFGRGINEITNKCEALQPYCYSIAMENYRSDYYYTEKIIDCFLLGVIPIYYGCPSIGDVFDENGIISFSSMEELNSILSMISFSDYRSRISSVNKNRNICLEKSLNSYDSYWKRVIRSVLDNKMGFGPNYMKCNRYSAGIRKLFRA